MNEANHYVPGFTANLELLPQQKNSRLIQCVDSDLSYGVAGKLFNADDVDTDEPRDISTRIPDSPEGQNDHMRRVGFFRGFHDGRFIQDDLEGVRRLTDPTDKIMSAMMAKKWVKHDRLIIATFDGPSYNGENGTDVQSFPSSQIIGADDRDFLHDAESVAASGDLPITVGKLIKTGVLLDESEIDEEEDGGDGLKRFFVWGPRQKGQLLSSTPSTSSDYSTVKALVKGEIDEAFGFTFINSLKLTKTGNNRRCFGFIKKAVQFKARTIQKAWIRPRDDKSGRMYAYYETEHGALRRYDKGVVAVDCKET